MQRYLKQIFRLVAHLLPIIRVLFYGDKASQEDIEFVTPKHMSIFLNGLNHWIEKTLPNAKINPDETMRREVYFGQYVDYPLTSIVRWLERKFGSW